MDTPGQGKKRPEMETRLLAGCVMIAVISLGVLALCVWPFFVFKEEFSAEGLAKTLAAGMAPALASGVFAIRKLRETGLVGFVGGAMAYGVFLFIRMGQVFVTEGSPDLVQPDYPRVWMWLVPALWAVVSLGVSALAFPKQSQAT